MDRVEPGISNGFDINGKRILPNNEVVAKEEVKSLGQKLKIIEQKITTGTSLSRENLFILYQKDDDVEALKHDTSRTLKKLREMRTDAEVDFDFCVMFNCLPNELAHNPSEITDDTKVYIGKIYPNFFNQKKLPDIIYDKYPGGFIKIDRITSGGLNKDELLDQFKNKNIKISSEALALVNSENFETSKEPERVTFVSLRVADLFPLNDDKHEYEDICGAAESLGLKMCQPQDGPNYCLNAAITKFANIGMERVRLEGDEYGDQATRIFSVSNHSSNKPSLSGEEVFDITQFSDYENFVFRAGN